MKRFTSLSALFAVLFLPALSVAEGMPEGANLAGESAGEVVASPQAEAEIGWDQFDDPNFDLAVAPVVEGAESVSPDETVAAEPTDAEILGSIAADKVASPQIQFETRADATPSRSGGVVLGPRGVDDLGRAGRLHTVARGDTLWDLAAAYLGTPWVWPSVWIDNTDIENPHLISPGNKIWITANEMRIVTDAEAESFLVPAAQVETAELETDVDETLAMDGLDESAPVAALEDGSGDLDEPSTLEAFPVAVPGSPVEVASRGRRVTVARREAMGFVSAEALAGASSIVGSPTERIFVASGDDVILGVGEGDVEVGDQFSIFTVIEEVRDPESLRLLGHHVDPLGWLEVTELTGDTSIARIRTSYSEISRGARVVSRNPMPRSVEVRSTPDAIEGRIVFLPSERTIMADGGYVYLNRGEFHGVEAGSELEVFDPGSIVADRARRVDVRTPDQVVARLVVVSVEPESSVGFVLWSKRELIVGDAVRPTIPTLAQR